MTGLPKSTLWSISMGMCSRSSYFTALTQRLFTPWFRRLALKQWRRYLQQVPCSSNSLQLGWTIPSKRCAFCLSRTHRTRLLFSKVICLLMNSKRQCKESSRSGRKWRNRGALYEAQKSNSGALKSTLISRTTPAASSGNMTTLSSLACSSQLAKIKLEI